MRTVHNQMYLRRHSRSTQWWNDVPRGTMDEVSSHVCLDLPSVYNGTAAEQIVPPRPRSQDGRALAPIPKRSTSP